MRPTLFLVRLTLEQLGHRPGRAALLALAVAIGGATVFTVNVLRLTIERSMTIALDRLGADLLVVPRETTAHLASALLTVEPTPHTFDQATAERLSSLPSVARAARQLYVPLPSANSEHGDLDLVAFDPAGDLTILCWLAETLDRPMRPGDVIVGGRRPESIGSRIPLFGQTFPVYGKLALTGVGPFERALFVSFETAGQIADAGQKTIGRKILDADTPRYSALLVRLKPGATVDEFRFAVAGLKDIQVVAGNGLQTSVRQGLTTILGGATLFNLFALGTTGLLVGAIYSGLLAERRRELGLLLAVGMRPGRMLRMILAEASLMTALGGVAGVVLSAAALVFFRHGFGFMLASQQAPFLLPPAGELVWLGLSSVVVTGAVGALGSLLPAWRTTRREVYVLIRGEVA